MKKAIFVFIIAGLVIAAMLLWYFSGGFNVNWQEISMLAGLVLVISFAVILGVRRIRSIRNNQPAEDEMSKGVVKQAASTTFYISLYSWLALMFFSDKSEMETSTQMGIGIMLMAVEFALAWVYFNFFGKINE